MRGFFMRGEGSVTFRMRRTAGFAAIFSLLSSSAKLVFKTIRAEWTRFPNSGGLAGGWHATHTDSLRCCWARQAGRHQTKNRSRHKNTPIYLHKVQNVLSFPFLARFFGRKLSTLSVPSATPSPGWPQLWWKTSKARRQGASREDAASKAPFARPSIKGVHHAGMHA